MLSGPSLAAVLRKSHFQLRRFASDLEARAQPYQIAERSALGPTWQYGEDTDPVRYHDGQYLTLADGRGVAIELWVIFELDCVTVDGRLGVDIDEDSEIEIPAESFGLEMMVHPGPLSVCTDGETVAAVSEVVREITARASLLEELRVPVCTA